MRSTFLHFLYPAVVPIFDEKVLEAVGVREKDGNRRFDLFEAYVEHAWELESQYGTRVAGLREAPLRAIEMALWIVGH